MYHTHIYIYIYAHNVPSDRHLPIGVRGTIQNKNTTKSCKRSGSAAHPHAPPTCPHIAPHLPAPPNRPRPNPKPSQADPSRPPSSGPGPFPSTAFGRSPRESSQSQEKACLFLTLGVLVHHFRTSHCPCAHHNSQGELLGSVMGSSEGNGKRL